MLEPRCASFDMLRVTHLTLLTQYIQYHENRNLVSHSHLIIFVSFRCEILRFTATRFSGFSMDTRTCTLLGFKDFLSFQHNTACQHLYLNQNTFTLLKMHFYCRSFILYYRVLKNHILLQGVIVLQGFKNISYCRGLKTYLIAGGYCIAGV